jgi:outer membrane receptor protein involved in Fe transport
MKGAIALALMAGAAPLAAQAIVEGRTVYQAEFFVAFAAANAFQMVQRVPGFQLEEIDQEVRGFGQAAGNVVINGQRPSAKSDSLETLLSRIPAARVARIEVGPGDAFSADLLGKPQVVNIVLLESGGLAGTIEARVRRDFTGKLRPEGQVSALLRRGASSFNLSAGVENDDTSEEGQDLLTSLPGGELVEFRKKMNRIDEPELFLAGAWSHDGGPNRTANVNARVATERFMLTQFNDVFPAAAPPRDDLLTQRYDTDSIEIGGDITRPALGGALKLVGVFSQEKGHNEDVVLNRSVDGTLLGGFEQVVDDKATEAVARLSWSKGIAGWSFETGGELVVNRLASEVALAELAPDGGSTPIDLPLADVVVKEVRGEAFVTAGRPLSPFVRLDLGLTGELSRLTVSGDADEDRRLTFWKPSLVLDWRPGKARFQVSAKRSVDQLDFQDFVSAAEFANDRVDGGNAELVPESAWELLATFEHPLLGSGLVKASLGYDFVSDVVDRVPTPEGLDAPGNLGSGRRFNAGASIDIPVTAIGIKGGRASAGVSVVDTSVTDPYTFETRRFSGNTLWLLDVNLRQDLAQFAWGASFYANSGNTAYRRNEEDHFFRHGFYVTAFAEYRPSARTSVTLSVDNLTNVSAYRERTFFDPTRANPNPYLLERRERNQHIIPMLGVKHAFG